MTAEATLVLNHRQIEQKITRIAHELIEHHIDDQEIILVGITPRGNVLAERIHSVLVNVGLLKSRIETITLDKNEPLAHPVACSLSVEEAKNRSIMVVDDVLNTGKALIFAVKHILSFDPKTLHTITLVDRKHRMFPVRADYVGLTLATTIQDHISVEFGKEDKVYLK